MEGHDRPRLGEDAQRILVLVSGRGHDQFFNKGSTHKPSIKMTYDLARPGTASPSIHFHSQHLG